MHMHAHMHYAACLTASQKQRHKSGICHMFLSCQPPSGPGWWSLRDSAAYTDALFTIANNGGTWPLYDADLELEAADTGPWSKRPVCLFLARFARELQTVARVCV